MEILHPIPAADAPAVFVLAAGGTLIDAAKSIGVSRNTMAVRAGTPEYKAAIKAVQMAAIDRAAAKLIQGLEDAYAATHMILTDGEKDADRLRAAKHIFDLALLYHERSDLAARIMAIEEQLGCRATTAKPEPTIVLPE